MPRGWRLGLLCTVSLLVSCCKGRQNCILLPESEEQCSYSTYRCDGDSIDDIVSDRFYDSPCPNYTVKNDDNNYFFKLTEVFYNSHWVIEFINEGREIPIYDPNYRVGLVIAVLHIDHNNINIHPSFIRMDNLVKLDLSHNYLKTAKLFNPNELKSLKEIDYSYNEISSIEVDDAFEGAYRKLRKLNLSHNALTEIKDSAFDTFSELEVLDLSHNNIYNLTNLSFEGIRGLKNLDLSFNGLVNIHNLLFRFVNLEKISLSHNRITELGNDDFDRQKKLLDVDLSNNFIENIENRIFQNLNNVIKISLRGNMLKSLSDRLFNNTSNLDHIDLSDNEIKLLQTQLFANTKISVFTFKGNLLEGVLIKGMFDGLALIPELDLSNQLISAVDDYAFFGLENLKTLKLNNNNIATISKYAFKSLHGLKKLDLSSNKISVVYFETNDLISLEDISLQKNVLCDIEKNKFDGMHMLKFLDVSNNNISKLENEYFNSLANLIRIDIFNNPIQGVLEPNTFQGLHSLPSLDLSKTALTKIANNTFGGMMLLSNVNISHSKISELEFNSFANSGNIMILDLSHNELKDFHINMTAINKLTILLLCYDKLEKISSSVIEHSPHLRKLDLSHNKITFIDATFDNLKYLNEFNLSYNENLLLELAFLSRIPSLTTLVISGIQTNFTFASAQSSSITNIIAADCNIKDLIYLNFNALDVVEKLVLSHNDIQSVQVGSFSKLPLLKYLDLSFNKLTVIQPGSFKDSSFIYMLNISHNSLTTVNYGIFSGLTQLNTLDISYNNLFELKDERFYDVKSLRELIIDYNKIRHINVEELSFNTDLTLSVGGNPLDCEDLVNLKKRGSLQITAINMYEANKENVFGVSCIGALPGVRVISNHSLAESEAIMSDIREIIFNMSHLKYPADEKPVNSKSSDFLPKNFNTLPEKIDEINYGTKNLVSILNNLTESLLKEAKKTNDILEKSSNAELSTSKAVSSTINSQTTPSYYFDRNKENVSVFIKQMKEDIQESIAVQNTVITEMKSLIESKFENLSSMVPTNDAINDRLTIDKKPVEAKSLFTETCVGLTLLLLVCVVLWKFYESRMFVAAPRSTSTRRITDAEDAQL